MKKKFNYPVEDWSKKSFNFCNTFWYDIKKTLDREYDILQLLSKNSIQKFKNVKPYWSKQLYFGCNSFVLSSLFSNFEYFWKL